MYHLPYICTSAITNTVILDEFTLFAARFMVKYNITIIIETSVYT